jgi:CDP-diacylglycerol---glycerol-3-phosphate 3-phosphatidyltransferase
MDVHTRQFRSGMIVTAAVSLAVAAAGAALYALLLGPADPARGGWWALKTGAVLAWQLGFLALNRRRVLQGENLPHMWGTANRLTLARGMLLALLAGFLFEEEPRGAAGWMPALLYTVAAVADFLDGFWARRTGTQTRLGALLDGELDAVGILVAVGLTVQYGRLPAGFLVLGLARPAYSAGLAIHTMRGGEVRELPPSYMRRRLAGFQMGITAVFLWPVARPPVTTLAQVIIAIPLLAGFLRDGLAASGLLDPRHPAYQAWKGRAGRLLFGWGPPVYRMLAGLSAALRVALAVSARLQGADPLAPWRPAGIFLPASAQPAAAVAVTGVQLAALAVMAAGFPRRGVSIGALVFLLLEALRSFQGGLDPVGAVTLCAALLLYVFRPARSSR